ncbi:hypothetical protein BGY98DRAFT_1100936 [Russula aff. rugulosa BPL654]|nr:hypothetical protein BGY98DRAFT_1100936 [Russula aff. rugulosa BPL654]
MAAFESHWKDEVQAISYLHYLLLARPDFYVAQGLLISNDGVTFLFGIGGAGIRDFKVEWAHKDFYKLLYAFIYRLYEPGDFADPSYIKTDSDKKTAAKYTIKIAHPQGTKECHGFYPIYAGNPFATRTHVLSNPNFKVENDDLTILKDQFCRVKRRFQEITILKEYVHNPKRVPGVVVAVYGEKIDLPQSEERCKQRLGLRESGSRFTSIPTLYKVLETLFDVLEVLRYLRFSRKVLHRDISSGNVLYAENSSNRSLKLKTGSVPPKQKAETNELPLYYAKYLTGDSVDPLETSMLLVDFNLAEHLEPEANVKEKQIVRTGTPLFTARAVEQGKYMAPVLARVPETPDYPDSYAKVHPDRVKRFPSGLKDLVIDPKRIDVNKRDDGWRHELDHDTESVFWLLLYWAMVVQPADCLEETINSTSWSGMLGNFENDKLSSRGLASDLAGLLVIDRHWLPESDPPDPRSDLYYLNEAFQRLIIKFMIDNKDKIFMHRRVEKIFRKVEGTQDSNAKSTTASQTVDAETRSESSVKPPAMVDMEMADRTDTDCTDDITVTGDDTEMVDVR